MDLDFKLHIDTIEAWIRSCRLEPQLPICEDAIQNILISKFKGKVDDLELDIEVKHLQNEIEEKLREIRYYSQGKPYVNEAIDAYTKLISY